jgi:hypothetical protein
LGIIWIFRVWIRIHVRYTLTLPLHTAHPTHPGSRVEVSLLTIRTQGNTSRTTPPSPPSTPSPPDEIDALEDLGRRTPDPRLDARNFVLSSYLVKKAGKWERKCGREVRDAFVYYAFGVKVREPGLRDDGEWVVYLERMRVRGERRELG